MNVLDIKFKADLSRQKTKVDAIDQINRLSMVILNEAKSDGAERYRFWYNKLRNIHPLVDRYLSGQIVSSDISDITGEHIINTQADTQSVDLKFYYQTVRDSQNTIRDNSLIPLPIRNSIRSKIPSDQLEMTESSYIKLNQAYSIIMSTFFQSSDPNRWTISRNTAHSYYSTQDYYGFSIKLLLYDSQMQVMYEKYKEKIALIDSIIPISESIIIDHDPFIITVEAKEILVDNFMNKIINMPSSIDNSVLLPKELI